MNDRSIHHTITFLTEDFGKKENCPRCHREKPLGHCNDKCKMCQSCWSIMQHGEGLPSDDMV